MNTRGDKQCCSCLERSDDPEQTSSGNTPSTRAARGGGECGRPPVHAQHVEERAEAQRRRGANTAPTEANSLGKMDSLDDAGEKKPKADSGPHSGYTCKRTKEHFPTAGNKHVQKNDKSKANCRQEKSIANSRQRHM